MKLLILFFVLLAPLSSYSADLGVFPLYFDFTKADAPDEDFKITVKSNKATKVKASLYKASQAIDGKLNFEKVEPAVASQIIKLKKDKHTFYRKSNWVLEGKVLYPKKINKTDAYAVMIEEVIDKDKKGISVTVRYAVVLKIQSSNQRAYETGNLEIGSFFSNNNKIYFKSEFKNLSVKDYKVESVLTVRNSQGKLVEKTKLNSQSAWQRRADASLVFPGAKIEVFAPLKKIVQPGEYSIQVVSKINNKRQIIKSKKIKIGPEVIPKSKIKLAEMARVELTPGKLEVDLLDNRYSLFRFKIDNPKGEDVVVKMPEAFSDSQKGEYKFMPSELTIPAGRSRTAIFKVKKTTEKPWVLSHLKATIEQKSKNTKLALPVYLVEKK